MQPLQRVEDPEARKGRMRAAWRAAHEPVVGVPWQMRLAAYAVVLVVLPSSVWRLPAAAFDSGRGLGERTYVVFLSVVSEALAFTAFGLIARWGEVFPRWLPLLRGRRVPTMAAVVPVRARRPNGPIVVTDGAPIKPSPFKSCCRAVSSDGNAALTSLIGPARVET